MASAGTFTCGPSPAPAPRAAARLAASTQSIAGTIDWSGRGSGGAAGRSRVSSSRTNVRALPPIAAPSARARSRAAATAAGASSPSPAQVSISIGTATRGTGSHASDGNAGTHAGRPEASASTRLRVGRSRRHGRTTAEASSTQPGTNGPPTTSTGGAAPRAAAAMDACTAGSEFVTMTRRRRPVAARCRFQAANTASTWLSASPSWTATIGPLARSVPSASQGASSRSASAWGGSSTPAQRSSARTRSSSSSARASARTTTTTQARGQRRLARLAAAAAVGGGANTRIGAVAAMAGTRQPARSPGIAHG